MLQTLPCLPTCDFTRFEFYAPLVQSVLWYPSRIETISDWGSFISYAHSRTLLPNLRYIQLAAGLSSQDYFWFTTLSSTSLLGITTGPTSHKPSSDIEDTSRLFWDIVLRCPALRMLGLCYRRTATGEPALLIQPGNTSLYQHIATMGNLRLHSMGTEIFQPAVLQLIGSLPLLDTLEIKGYSPLALPLQAINLPSSSFPALRDLKILSLNPEEFINIWTIDPLVARLEVVALVFHIDAEHNISIRC